MCTRKGHLVHLLCVLNKKGHLVCGHQFSLVSKLFQCISDRATSVMGPSQ